MSDAATATAAATVTVTGAAPLPWVAEKARHAALLLHALAEGDREWLIGQLRDSEQGTVRSLLAELRALGLPADPRFVDEALAEARQAIAASAPPAPPSRSAEAPPTAEGAAPDQLRALAAADVGALTALLRDEPALLTVQLLRLCDPPWRSAVLQRIGGAKRMDIEARLAASDRRDDIGGAVPPALAAKLTEVIVSRLALLRSSRSEEMRPRTRWTAWLRRARRTA